MAQEKLDPRLKLVNVQDGYADVVLRGPYEERMRESSIYVQKAHVGGDVIRTKNGSFTTPAYSGWYAGYGGDLYETRTSAANSLLDGLLAYEKRLAREDHEKRQFMKGERK